MPCEQLQVSCKERLHNHLTDFHRCKRGSEIYKKCLKVALPHEIVEISSTTECDSTSSEERVPRKKRKVKKRGKRIVKKEKHESIFKNVYSSDESEDDDEKECMKYPSIFKQTSSEDEEIIPENEESFPSSEDEYTEKNRTKDEMHDRDEILPEPSDEQHENTDESSSDGNYYDESDSVTENECFSTLLNADPKEQDICKQFEKWLQTADGGRKDEINAFQCSRRIEMVMQYISPENPSMKNLLHKQTLRDCWLTKFEKERQPGTVKSYLGALRQFYSFLQCESPRNINASEKTLSSLIAQMTQWSKSYHKLVKDRFWEKRMDDMAKLRKPEDIREYSSSEVARAAVSMLGLYQEKPQGTVPSQAEYTAVRDYLITSICITNGSRSGALANMTVGEFNKAQSLDDSFVVKVKKHKTFSTHGPVNLVLTPTLHNWMKIFISKFRLPVANMTCKDGETVFLTWSNRRMDSSHIGSQINSSWGKVFGKEGAVGGATAFRKAAVSAVHRDDQERREDLAGLMVHNKATTDRYYLLEEKAAAAVKTSNYLSKVLHAEVPSAKAASPEDTVTQSSQQEKNVEDPLSISSHKERNVEDPPSTSSQQERDVQPSSSQQWSPSQRRKWVPEEEEAIKKLFSSNIRMKFITIGKVKRHIRDHPLLQNIPPLKVRDKIRTFFGSETSELPQIPVETREERLTRSGYNTRPPAEKQNYENKNDTGSEYTPSIISPSTCASKKSAQKLFVENEHEDFSKLFKDLIESKRPIAKKTVKERLEKEPTLCHLLQKCTLLQLADKVRTERKVHFRNTAGKCEYKLYL